MPQPESRRDPLHSSPWRTCVPALARGEHLPLLDEVAELRKEGKVIFPPQNRIFYALKCTAPKDVRVVILGQDPYHGPGQAMGLAFSVAPNTPCPRSLGNIFKEIHSDVKDDKSDKYKALLSCPSHRPDVDLTRWAKQGVLLLNTVLTVEQGRANSHATLASGTWQSITHAVLEAVAHGHRPVAVLLWGNPAKHYAPLFAEGGHLVLCAAHPSPLSASRGFFGCKHFSQVNAWLKAQGEKPVCW